MVWLGHDSVVILCQSYQVKIVYYCQNVQEREIEKSQFFLFQLNLRITLLDNWNNFFSLDISGFTKDHKWVMNKPYQTKSSLWRPYFRCFWPLFLTKINFFPIFSGFVTPSHYRTGLRNTEILVPSMETFFLLGNASRPVCCIKVGRFWSYGCS